MRSLLKGVEIIGPVFLIYNSRLSGNILTRSSQSSGEYYEHDTTVEIPTDVRKITEKSVEQVKTAISGYLQFLQRAVPGGVMGGSELSNKILGYAERNVASAFEFAQRLVQVRDAQELTKLQADFVQAQMQAMTEQAKDLGETATKAVMDKLKTPTMGGLSS
ncbi:MAG: phasin family protein [Rhodoplanes sp.]